MDTMKVRYIGDEMVVFPGIGIVYSGDIIDIPVTDDLRDDLEPVDTPKKSKSKATTPQPEPVATPPDDVTAGGV